MSIIFSVGGRWHKRYKCWVEGETTTTLQCRLHPGQIEAARWFKEWFTAYLAGDDNAAALAIFSVLLMGGTRSGKTYLGLYLAIAFMVAVPKSRVWFVQEVEVERAEELESELASILPDAWFAKGKRGASYTCINGAVGRIRSAKYPAKLKRGRCDFAFLNEGQNVQETAHRRLRERTSDTGGIVVTAANPANKNIEGVWVDNFYKECEAGRRVNSRAFHFVYTDNPHVKQASMDALQHETSVRDWEIDVLGIPKPPINAVYHAFDYRYNIAPTPQLGDITADFAYKIGLGRNVTDIVGLDFQRSPHMAGVRRRLYRNSRDPARPFFWCIAEYVVELGDERDLSAAMYRDGLLPESTVLICDASGAWQDGEHNPNCTSYATLREEGWHRLHVPDTKEKRNPLTVDRMKNDNRLFTSKAGLHQVRIDEDACPQLVEAVKKWLNGATGVPKRWADESHICDAMSYPNWRAFPLIRQVSRVRYKSLKRRTRRSQFQGL